MHYRINGSKLATQLEAAPETASIPIIALTNARLPHERVSAMRAGCDRHLTEPCVDFAMADRGLASSYFLH